MRHLIGLHVTMHSGRLRVQGMGVVREEAFAYVDPCPRLLSSCRTVKPAWGRPAAAPLGFRPPGSGRSLMSRSTGRLRARVSSGKKGARRLPRARYEALFTEWSSCSAPLPPLQHAQVLPKAGRRIGRYRRRLRRAQ